MHFRSYVISSLYFLLRIPTGADHKREVKATVDSSLFSIKTNLIGTKRKAEITICIYEYLTCSLEYIKWRNTTVQLPFVTS